MINKDQLQIPGVHSPGQTLDQLDFYGTKESSVMGLPLKMVFSPLKEMREPMVIEQSWSAPLAAGEGSSSSFLGNHHQGRTLPRLYQCS